MNARRTALARATAAVEISSARRNRRPTTAGVEILAEAREVLCRRVCETMLYCASAGVRQRDHLRREAEVQASAWSLVDQRVTRARLQRRAPRTEL